MDQHDDRVAEWFRHPVTELVHKGLEGDAEKALVEVLGNGRVSTDAAVRAAVMKYDALKRFAKTLKGEE